MASYGLINFMGKTSRVLYYILQLLFMHWNVIFTTAVCSFVLTFRFVLKVILLNKHLNDLTRPFFNNC